MTRPNTEQAEAVREIVEQLDDMVDSIDVSSTRILITLYNGAVLGPTLRIGWRPVGLELSLHDPGEDPDAHAPHVSEAIAAARAEAREDFDALRRGFHVPTEVGESGDATTEGPVGLGRLSGEVYGGPTLPVPLPLPHCKRCGHVRSQHRTRGDGYCTGVVEHPGTLNTDDPEAPWSEPCGCPGWEEPDA